MLPGNHTPFTFPSHNGCKNTKPINTNSFIAVVISCLIFCMYYAIKAQDSKNLSAELTNHTQRSMSASILFVFMSPLLKGHNYCLVEIMECENYIV